ncbi:MAG: T9SS type A sorting domain-containing protein [Sphingobacteriia bacterium]|nr:T9SS type A sorting domain-containing protein [Sphingobacteriia bacterium]
MKQERSTEMKTKLYTLLFLLLNSLWLPAQTYNVIPLETVKAIADRNAQALWGEVYPAEPIPYYGFDDEIIAWRFNYSIGKPFPSKVELQNQIKGFENEKDSYNQWGGDDFGRILIGARDNLPVLLEYSRCLSAEYALGNKLARLTSEAFGGKDATAGKIFYLNHFNTWHQVISKNESKYVCTSPTGGIINDEAFAVKKTDAELFIKPGDFKELWNTYQNGYVAPTDGNKYIDYHECMPFYDWSYGCSPTAAAMLFAWYDYRSLYVSSKYPYFVGWHFQRWDDPEEETDYNVCNLQLELALAMATDTLTGSTDSYNIDNGMNYVANEQRNYNFDCINRYTFLWTRLTEDIDAGKPLMVSIPGHSTTGVGYNESTNMAITHYTHDPPDHLVWVSRWNIDMITRVSAGGQKGSAIQLTRPTGDPRYNCNGDGEVFSAGDYAEITWLSDPVPGSWVDLFYSTNGGYNFGPIVLDTENDGVYNWLIPADISSTSCRVMAYLRTPEMEPYIAGADGSWGNFIINSGGTVAIMVTEHIYSSDSLSKYYHFQHNDPSWAVIGANSDFGSCNWEIQFYNNTNFNQTPAFYSTFGGFTNFMVVDGNHYPSLLRGIKIRPLADHRPVMIEYEGGDENLVYGSNGPYNWNADEIVEMKEIHLEPGRYYFELETNSGWPDFGMALYGSADGQYLRHRMEYLAYSDYSSGNQTESFNVTITQEDDYGLCIFSNSHETGNYTINIEDAFIWTGTVSTNWHDPDNWSGHQVPDIMSKVVISGDGYDTHIISADAICAQLNILHDGRLYIDNHNLTVNEDVTLSGWLLILNAASRLSYYGDLFANRYSYLEIAAGAGINAFGDWTFEENTNIQLNHGFVDFKGTSNSMVYSKSENSWFYDVKVSKTGGAFLAYDNCIGIEPMRIKNQFVLYDEAVFVQYALYDVIFEGPFLSYAGSHFYFQNGTQRFERVGTGGIAIFSESGSYFNNLVVSVEDWLGLASDIEIRGDLLLEEGMFKTLGYDVYLKGDWTNNAGFNHGNSRVIFNGAGIQEVTGTNFWEMELNKGNGELRVHESVVSVQHYDWTQGTVRVNGGWLQLNDLEDPGIYGTVILTSGQLDVHQQPDEYLDLNGNLEISDGEMNIYGGNGDSYWPFEADASFTMSGGILDFKDNGLRIYNSVTYSLSENITGGVIKIIGNLTVSRDDFNPSGGTILFYGSLEDATLSVASGSNLYAIEVNKSSKKKALVKTLTANGIVDLNGDFILEGGNFEAPAKMYVGGVFVNNQTPEHFDELTGEIVLDGAVDQIFGNAETFYKLTINKPGNGSVTVGNNAVLTVVDNLLIDRGNLVFESGTTLLLDGIFEANYLGNIAFGGEPDNEVIVTSATKSSYTFNLSPGGGIAAAYTIFSNMGIDGINLHSGAYIESDKAFTGCTFMNGESGGTLITWDNGAEVIVQDAVFPENLTGCTYNVRKTTNSGQLYFDEATGPFAGAAFEDDPFARINWEYVPPLTIPFSEKWASSSFTTNHWVPEGTNWEITESTGNPLPCAFFSYTPRIYNYSVPLRSHLIDGTDFTDISVKFDLRFDNYSLTTLEQFKIQAVHKNGDFITLETYNNSGGSFGFVTKEYDISTFADGEIFYLRFTAFGEDSWNIDGWYIDNIIVAGNPPEPGLLKGTITNQLTGLPVENAEVQIEGTLFMALSDETGCYFIPGIPKGVYDVTVTALDFEQATATGIEIISGASTIVNFSLVPIPPSYCTENLYTIGCIDGDGLDYFELYNLSNTNSGCSPGGYGDFTFLSTELPRGYAYLVWFASAFPDQFVSLWIDFDDDFEFEVEEKLMTDYHIEIQGEVCQSDIFIPENAPTGEHRLRVRTNRNTSSAGSCATYQYGEAEDYTIEITTNDITGAIMVTVSSSASGEPVENSSITLIGTDWTGITEEEGICIINGITPGIYDIEVTAPGYESAFINDFYIFGGETMQLETGLIPLPVISHEIVIPAGWSGLSSYVYPEETNLDSLFSEVIENLVILKSFTGMYWPSQNINTLNNWEHHSAYMIKTGIEIWLTISGLAEPDKSCVLNNGWTILPVVCNFSTNTNDLFFPVVSDLMLVKEIAGTGIYWPAMDINTLVQLQPGRAYLVRMQNTNSVIFPDNTKESGNNLIKTTLPEKCKAWEDPVPSAVSHVIAIPEAVLTENGIPDSDFIGVFTPDGICCGASELKGSTAITVFADDPLTNFREGFYTGEKMLFKWYRNASGEVYDLEMEFIPEYQKGVFEPMGISVVSGIKWSGTFVNNSNAINPVVYPNPSFGVFSISGILPGTEVFIYDSRGEVLRSFHFSCNQAVVDLSALPRGIYLMSVLHETWVFREKIIVN